MSGFTKSRIVNLNTRDVEDLTCGICLEIFNKPMMVKCCRQMYCDKCIREWLKTNEKCPNDRCSLTSNDLSQPPRVIEQIISNLELYCEFDKHGCNEVLNMNELDAHTVKCKFNPDQFCLKCGLKMLCTEEHDCIFSLKTFILRLKEENKRLREEMNLKARSLLYTDHLNLTLKSAKDWINSDKEPEIGPNGSINGYLLKEIIQISCKAILQSSSFDDISTFISDKLNNSGHNAWQIITYSKDCCGSLVCDDKFYLDISFGMLRIEIFTAGNIKKSLTRPTMNTFY